MIVVLSVGYASSQLVPRAYAAAVVVTITCVNPPPGCPPTPQVSPNPALVVIGVDTVQFFCSASVPAAFGDVNCQIDDINGKLWGNTGAFVGNSVVYNTAAWPVGQHKYRISTVSAANVVTERADPLNSVWPYTPPIGGVIVSSTLPLLVPIVGFAAVAVPVAATITAVYVRRVKHRREK